MIAGSNIVYIDYGVLGILGLFVLVCLFGLASSITLQGYRLPRETKAFCRTWPGRIGISLLGTLLLASQVLRMSSVWNGLTESQSLDGVLCRVYLTAALGLFQPAFLFSALLLCRHSVRQHGQATGASDSCRLVLLATLLSLPFVAVQTVVAWMSEIFSGANWDADRNSVGHYFFSPYDYATAEQCNQNEGCVLCIFPAASTIATGFFAALYSLALVRFTNEMGRAIINRRLRLRVSVLQMTTLVSLSTQVVMAAVSVISPPWTWLFQVAWLVYVAAVCGLVFTVTWILVISPVWSVRSAQKALVQVDAAFASEQLGLQEMHLLAKGTSESVHLV